MVSFKTKKNYHEFFIGYCAAKARAVLGKRPEKVLVEASGNIIKNVKSVKVPGTDGGRGIETASAIGILGGDENAGLQVIANAPSSAKEELTAYMAETAIEVRGIQTPEELDIRIRVWAGDDTVFVRIAREHTFVTQIEKNGTVLEEKVLPAQDQSEGPDYSLLNMAGILDFAETCDLKDVEDVLDRMMTMNSAIAARGLKESFGAQVGRHLLEAYGDDVRIRARATAAAGSDARMNGCELPVVITSGSGNQGMTCSLPVLVYAKDLQADQEHTCRALLVSVLTTIYEKIGIGRLSAYCGAVSAGAGIAWLNGASHDVICQTVTNALAITSGIVCDGAKSSCAAKISAAVDAGIIGFEMARGVMVSNQEKV